jgi:hypothetical protein
LNLHALRQRILSPSRLPFRHPRVSAGALGRRLCGSTEPPCQDALPGARGSIPGSSSCTRPPLAGASTAARSVHAAKPTASRSAAKRDLPEHVPHRTREGLLLVEVVAASRTWRPQGTAERPMARRARDAAVLLVTAQARILRSAPGAPSLAHAGTLTGCVFEFDGRSA